MYFQYLNVTQYSIYVAHTFLKMIKMSKHKKCPTLGPTQFTVMINPFLTIVHKMRDNHNTAVLNMIFLPSLTFYGFR